MSVEFHMMLLMASVLPWRVLAPKFTVLTVETTRVESITTALACRVLPESVEYDILTVLTVDTARVELSCADCKERVLATSVEVMSPLVRVRFAAWRVEPVKVEATDRDTVWRERPLAEVNPRFRVERVEPIKVDCATK